MALQITEAFCPSDSNPFFSIPPPNLKKSASCKSPYQYELLHLSHNERSRGIQPTDIDIYKTSAKPQPKPSFFKSLVPCLNPPKIPPASFQLTELSEHPVPSGGEEKFIPLHISKDSPRGSNYAHIHVGAIQLALTFHNKRGLPIATRMALLDPRYKNYQHACLGMVETTLNSGTVVLTLFPDCTIPMDDRCFCPAFLVQIQIVGASMDPSLVQATLYSRTACRFQYHVFGLGLDSTGDIPLIQIESGNAPTTIHIPTSMSRPELVAILPEAWVSSYEKRQAEEETKRNPFKLNADGTITFRFRR